MISSGVIASLLIGSILLSRNFLHVEKDRAWIKFKVVLSYTKLNLINYLYI